MESCVSNKTVGFRQPFYLPLISFSHYTLYRTVFIALWAKFYFFFFNKTDTTLFFTLNIVCI